MSHWFSTRSFLFECCWIAEEQAVPLLVEMDVDVHVDVHVHVDVVGVN